MTTSATLHGRPHQRARKRTMLAPGRAHVEWGPGRVAHRDMFPSAHTEPRLRAADGGVDSEQSHPSQGCGISTPGRRP